MSRRALNKEARPIPKTFFSEIGQLVSLLDCLVGFAVVAVTAPIPYSKPKIVDTVGTIKLVEARHPCLELLDNINFIPNSIDFDKVNLDIVDTVVRIRDQTRIAAY